MSDQSSGRLMISNSPLGTTVLVQLSLHHPTGGLMLDSVDKPGRRDKDIRARVVGESGGPCFRQKSRGYIFLHL
jgi:hypothetical protein